MYRRKWKWPRLEQGQRCNWPAQTAGIQGGQDETQSPVSVKPAPPELPSRIPGNNKKNRVGPGPKREPAVISLQETILESSGEEEDAMGIQMHGAMTAMTDASKRLRSPASSMFEERLTDFESDDWETIEDFPPGHTTYTPILDTEGLAGGVSVGPYPPSSPEHVRLQMANSHVPSCSTRLFVAFPITRSPMGQKSASFITASGREFIWVMAGSWGAILCNIWPSKSDILVWVKISSTFNHCKPKLKLRLSPEHSR